MHTFVKFHTEKNFKLLASESSERYSCSGCQLVQRNSQFSFPHPPLLAFFGACDETQLKMNDLKASSRIESKHFCYAANHVCGYVSSNKLVLGSTLLPWIIKLDLTGKELLKFSTPKFKNCQIITVLSPSSHQVDFRFFLRLCKKVRWKLLRG